MAHVSSSPNYCEEDNPIGNDVETSIERQDREYEMLWEPVMGKKLNFGFDNYFCKWYAKNPLTLPKDDGKCPLVVKKFRKYESGTMNPQSKNRIEERRMVYPDIVQFTLESKSFKMS